LSLRPFELYEEYSQIFCNAIAVGSFKAFSGVEKAVEDSLRRTYQTHLIVGYVRF
jgi:hypothetical protein